MEQATSIDPRIVAGNDYGVSDREWTRFVWGLSDRVIPVAAAASYHRRIPHVRPARILAPMRDPTHVALSS
jgi:hypothetical protein